MMEIDRRNFIKMGAAAALTAPVLGQRPARKPNLVFLFSDQQSWDYLGASGLSSVQTPHLDRLASEGARFNQCVSNCPVCTPYRGMLMTGQHPLNNGAYANDLGIVRGQGATFAESLSDAGYDTAYIGKWHLQGGLRNKPVYPENRLGFNQLFLTNNCTVDFHPGECFYWNEGGERVYFDKWEQDGQTDQAIDYLSSRQNADNPFALVVSWHPPHNHKGGVGYDAPEAQLQRYSEANIDCRFHTQPNERLRKIHHGYSALCSSIDDCVGRIMEKLEAIGEADDTLFVFTSDHGDTLEGYNRQTHKCCPESPATRVPLIMRWPGKIKAGTRRELLVGTLDLMPTILSMLKITPPEECQGHDLANAIFNGNDDVIQSQPLFFFWWNWRGVYTREFTYAVGGFATPNERQRTHADFDVLYEHKSDPWNRNNLYHRSDYQATRQQLHQTTMDWLDRFEDPFMDERTLMLNTAKVEGHGEPSKQPISDMTFPESPLATMKRLGVPNYRPRI